MKEWLLSALLGCVLAVFASSAWSLGFGQPSSRAIMGESLALSIPLRVSAGEEVEDSCLVADVFFGDEKQPSAAVTVSMGPVSDELHMIQVRTKTLIQEPIFTVYLVAGCKAKITRKIVGFADPPGMKMEPAQVASLGVSNDKTSAASSQAVSQPNAKTQSLPRLVGVPTIPKTAKNSSSATSSGASGGSRQGVSQTLVAVGDARIRAAGTARLELDPAAVGLPIAPSLNLTSSLTLPTDTMDSTAIQERRAAAAALWAAMNASPELLVRDRQRTQELEARLARLQQDAKLASQKLQNMEIRVREAGNSRLNHPLIYGLAGVCALLAGALGWLFLRQRSTAPAKTDWWQENPVAGGSLTPSDMVDSSLADEDDKAALPVFDSNTQPAALTGMSRDAAAIDSNEANPHLLKTLQASEVAFGSKPLTVQEGLASTQAIHLKHKEPMREISVEELIDLEQQADFFVVLGQDNAAIELLENHVQSGVSASPLPFLKLLEIYQRLGQRDNYERIQQAFNLRFNAYAPSWESDLQQGDALQDYPDVLERLQALWSSPSKAMEVLNQSLIKPDKIVETFDLPAYRELLLLYSVARDLSDQQQDDHLQVDIDVPDLSLDKMGTSAILIAPLTATRPIKGDPQALPTIQVDFNLVEPDEEAASEAFRAGKHLEPIDFVVVPDDDGGKSRG